MATSVSSVYLHVVDSVVSKLREEFLNEGADDSVLNELQGLWELKMLQCGVTQGPIERNAAPRAAIPAHVRDLNVPYEGPEEYETPTAEMLFPPTPLQTPIPQTPLPVEPVAYQYFPPGPSPGEYGTMPDSGAAGDSKAGRPAPSMQTPSPWMNQRPLGVDVNVAYEEGGGSGVVGGGGMTQPPMKDFFMLTAGKRKRDEYPPSFYSGGYNIPQQDGSSDAALDHSLHYSLREKDPLGKSFTNKEHTKTFHDSLRLQERRNADATIASIIKKQESAGTIPQQDGYDDVYDNISNEDYNAPAYYDLPTPHNMGTPKPTKSETLEDEEPPLNEDDDDDVDDLEQGDEESSTNQLVLAQFEKVSRTKSRWKCILKDGIMRLNNKDILFTKASGEFEF